MADTARHYETDQPLSLEAVRAAASKLPADIYRAKGIIHAAEDLGHRAVLQVVGRRVDFSPGDAWGEQPPRTQIVAIGASGAIDAEALQLTFDRCIAGRTVTP